MLSWKRQCLPLVYHLVSHHDAIAVLPQALDPHPAPAYLFPRSQAPSPQLPIQGSSNHLEKQAERMCLESSLEPHGILRAIAPALFFLTIFFGGPRIPFEILLQDGNHTPFQAVACPTILPLYRRPYTTEGTRAWYRAVS